MGSNNSAKLDDPVATALGSDTAFDTSSLRPGEGNARTTVASATVEGSIVANATKIIDRLTEPRLERRGSSQCAATRQGNFQTSGRIDSLRTRPARESSPDQCGQGNFLLAQCSMAAPATSSVCAQARSSSELERLATE